jgi:hypothetical protein
MNVPSLLRRGQQGRSKRVKESKLMPYQFGGMRPGEEVGPNRFACDLDKLLKYSYFK